MLPLSRRPDSLEEKYEFPPTVQVLGLVMSAVAVAPLPVVGIHQWVSRWRRGEKTDIATMMSPTETWGPANSNTPTQ